MSLKDIGESLYKSMLELGNDTNKVIADVDEKFTQYKKQIVQNITPPSESEVITTLSITQLAKKIKELISQSALAKIEIGELLIHHTQTIEHGGKENFYKQIGMAPTTAQYYMKIARNPEIQELKKNNKLDNLNMSEILKLINARINIRGENSTSKQTTKNDYTVLPFEKFDADKCKSTKVFKAQYKALSEEVLSLREELKKYKS